MTRPWDRMRRVLGPVIAPIYGGVVRWRNRGFDAGRGVVRVGRPVISVGNLTTGGTGKTPMVRWVVETLRAQGAKPAIAMRGYGAGATGFSDEAEEYRAMLPGVPIVAQPDRTAGIARLLASADGAQVTHIVLDDGMQHRRVYRDVEIVLVDATRDPRRDQLLPWGDLREPLSGLARADAVVVTRVDQVSADAAKSLTTWARGMVPQGVLATARQEWTELALRSPGRGDELREVAWLRGRRVLAVCAIGNPGAFVAQVEAAAGDAGLVRSLQLVDHDPYAPETVERVLEMARACECVVTTEKDWTKLSRVEASRWPVPVARARAATRVIEGADALTSLVINAGRHGA